MKNELEESKEHESRLRIRLEEMRDNHNDTEKKLLEQTMLKEQTIRDNERLQDQIEASNRENYRLDEEIQRVNQTSDSLKENLIVATEQIK